MTSAAASPATLPLETLFLHVFVLVDDLYPHIAPEALRNRPGVHRLACSDSEILTLSLVQEALSIDSEEAFHRFVRRNYLDLFPHLVSRDRYHRRRKALLYLHQRLFAHLACSERARAAHLIVDSAPVETVAFVRSQSGQASIPEASYGFIPSKKRHFFGLRLHALVTNEGTIADFALMPADAGERAVAKDLLRPHRATQVLADSGYDGPDLQRWSEAHGVDLVVRQRPSRGVEARTGLKGCRQMVETVFAMLADQFRVETTRAHSTWGVAVRVVAKVTSYNLSLMLNRLLGRPAMAVKSLYL